MPANTWQLQQPINTIVFDCDGTLSPLEGIDELAKNSGHADIVQRLTQDAMGKSGIDPDLYRRRLELVKPSYEQVVQMGELYTTHPSPDVIAVIQLLKRLNKTIFILSAGVNPAVLLFGEALNIPPSHVIAVDLKFDAEGNYLDFAHLSPLCYSEGKRVVISEIKKQYPEIIYVGDGLNDYAVYDFVSRFIGYGGAFYRQNLADLCEFYVAEPSMAAILPLVLTEGEAATLTVDEKQLYQMGLEAITAKRVKVGA